MAIPNPQNAPQNDFGEEILPFDIDADAYNFNTPPDEDLNEEPIDWDAVEAELGEWTGKAGGTRAEGGGDE